MTDSTPAEVQQLVESAVRVALTEQKQITKETAEAAAKEAVAEVFRQLGIDTKDFKAVEAFRESISWVNSYRRLSQSVGSKVIVTVTTIATTGIVLWLWEAFKQKSGTP